MSLVTCHLSLLFLMRHLTVTQMSGISISLPSYLAIYLLLLILCQKNIDIPLNKEFSQAFSREFVALGRRGQHFSLKEHNPNFILKWNKKIRCMP